MWLDDLIGYLSPEAGLRRARARSALSVVRGYDSAKMSRRTAAWRAPSSSANAEVLGALEVTRNRARDMVRNNEYAGRAIRALNTHCVGTGITAKYSNDAVQKAYDQWADSTDSDFAGMCNLYGLQALASGAMFESGEALLVRVWNEEKRIPLEIQVLEADYLDSLKTEINSMGFAVAGVQFNAKGKRIGYWMFDSHPGESGPFMRTRLQSKFMSASDVQPLYEIARPGQVRGMPKLHRSIMRLRDLAEYEEAELVRKKIEACFTAFVRTSDDRTQVGEAAAITGNTATSRVEKVSPGMINYLRENEEVSFGQPTPSGGYSDYTITQLHAIAAGADVNYELMTGDVSQVNYSSARINRLEFKAIIEQIQWLTFIPQFCGAVNRWFLEAAYMAGVVRPKPENVMVEYTTPRWEFVDPQKEVAAVKEEIAGGLTSLQEAQRQRGYKPEQLRKEQKQDAEAYASLGFKPDVLDGGKNKKKNEDSTQGDPPQPKRDGQPITVNVAPPAVTISDGAMRSNVEVLNHRRGPVVRQVIETDDDGVPTKVLEREATTEEAKAHA